MSNPAFNFYKYSNPAPVPVRGAVFSTRFPAHLKVCGNTIQPGAADSFTWSNYYANWDARWLTWTKPGIDRIAALGFNTVRLCGGVKSVLNGTITRSQYLTMQAQFIDYCASLGLYVFGSAVNTEDSGTYTATAIAAEAAAYCALCESRPNVIGICVSQEADGWTSLGPGSNYDDHVIIMAACRAVTSLPLTISYGGGIEVAADPNGYEPLIDFWEYHSYEVYGSHVTIKKIGDCIAAHPTKPILFGEYGGPVTDTNRIEECRLIAELATHPNVVGAIHWVIQEDTTDTTNQFGIYDGSGAVRSPDVRPYVKALPRRADSGSLRLPGTGADRTLTSIGTWVTINETYFYTDAAVSADTLASVDFQATSGNPVVCRVIIDEYALGTNLGLIDGGRASVPFIGTWRLPPGLHHVQFQVALAYGSTATAYAGNSIAIVNIRS